MMELKTIYGEDPEQEMEIIETEAAGAEMVELEEAQRLILERVKQITQTQQISLSECLGRILAEDIHAPIDNPPFDRSPVDGYACRAKDTVSATREDPVVLYVKEDINAGQFSSNYVCKGEAVRIMTGAPIPLGCDCCVKQEDTDYGPLDVCIYREYQPQENYCFCGEDFMAGTTLLKQGQKLTYIEVGILASMGIDEVMVYRNPKVVVFATGDELVKPGQPLLPGKIYNSNLHLLTARLKEFGVTPEIAVSAKDDVKQLSELLMWSVEDADLVITTGGVSVGKKDLMHKALKAAGAERVFWKLCLKPGTPTLFSMLSQIPVISLSGNPFGALANFELLVRPALRNLTGDDSMTYRKETGSMMDEFPKKSQTRRFIRGIWKNGTVMLPQGLHSSGAIGSMVGCNCMIDIKPGTDALSKGDLVTVILL